MRIPALVAILTLASATGALASNMGFKLHGYRSVVWDAWSACERADFVAEVRVVGLEAADGLPHHAMASLSVRRTWKGTDRTTLRAPASATSGGLLASPPLAPGMRAIVFVSTDDESGTQVLTWLHSPNAGPARRELRLLIERALRLQAQAPSGLVQWSDWRDRAEQYFLSVPVRP